MQHLPVLWLNKIYTKYTFSLLSEALAKDSTPGGNRTPNQMIRIHLLYPLSYGRVIGILPIIYTLLQSNII